MFCDEIHRITKLQQDLFLNAVQNRQIILFSVTTDNPSLNLHHSLVYKCSVFTLKRPTGRDIERMILRAIHSQKLQSPLLDDEFVSYLASLADGNCKTALNFLGLNSRYFRACPTCIKNVGHKSTKASLMLFKVYRYL